MQTHLVLQQNSHTSRSLDEWLVTKLGMMWLSSSAFERFTKTASSCCWHGA